VNSYKGESEIPQLLKAREKTEGGRSNQVGFYRLMQWLAVVAVADWIFARTLSRSAIFMPKSPVILTGFQAMLTLGNFAANVTSLLAIAAMAWIAWRLAQNGQRGLPIALGALLVINLGALIFAPSALVAFTSHLLAMSAIVMIVRPIVSRSHGAGQAVAVLVAAAAVFASEIHQAAAALSAIFNLSSPFSPGLVAFNVGEALVVASGFAFGWWMRPHRGERWIWFVASLPAIAFVGFYLGAPSISNVITIWSLGLTLFLPWPLYALSLWAITAAMLTGLKRGHPIGLAIPLLVAGGFASRLSTQLFLSLIALYLLAGIDELTGVQETESSGPQPALWLRLRQGWKVGTQ
jgi:hypothetical protein